jgi:hypothetical protein
MQGYPWPGPYPGSKTSYAQVPPGVQGERYMCCACLHMHLQMQINSQVLCIPAYSKRSALQPVVSVHLSWWWCCVCSVLLPFYAVLTLQRSVTRRQWQRLPQGSSSRRGHTAARLCRRSWPLFVRSCFSPPWSPPSSTSTSPSRLHPAPFKALQQRVRLLMEQVASRFGLMISGREVH